MRLLMQDSKVDTEKSAHKVDACACMDGYLIT